MGGALLSDPPGAGSIDSFPVHIHPTTDGFQHLLLLGVDGPVGARTNVEHEIAVLADRVEEGGQNFSHRLVIQGGRVAPGVAGDGSVRLPDEGGGVGEAAALHVYDARTPGHAVHLVTDGGRGPPLHGPVVVVSGKALQIGLERLMLDPPVKIEEFGPIGVDHLADPQEPIVQVFLGGIGLAEEVLVVRLGHGGPVEVAPLHRLMHVAVELLPVAHEPPVLSPVVGQGEMKALIQSGPPQLADKIAMGPLVEGVPFRQIAAVHLESIVVLGHGHVVASASPAEEVQPLVGVETLRLEHRDEVLVTELLLRSVGLHMVVELRAPLDVHVARVPLVIEGGHAV